MRSIIYAMAAIMDAALKIVISILMEKLKKEGAQDIPVVVGGFIPRKEKKFICKMGVKEAREDQISIKKS